MGTDWGSGNFADRRNSYLSSSYPVQIPIWGQESSHTFSFISPKISVNFRNKGIMIRGGRLAPGGIISLLKTSYPSTPRNYIELGTRTLKMRGYWMELGGGVQV